jgi:hypothetical protein
MEAASGSVQRPPIILRLGPESKGGRLTPEASTKTGRNFTDAGQEDTPALETLRSLFNAEMQIDTN